MSGEASTLKIPVSLRLPRDVVEAVDSYASAHALTKTDAYEHFLRLAISTKDNSDANASAALSQKLDAVLDALSNWQAPPSKGVKALTQEDVAQAIAATSKQFPAISRAILFGSFARGTFNANSDVDIRIELDRGKGFNLRDLSQYMKKIEQETGREVDVVSASNIKNPQLKEAIETEGVTVYERQEQ